MSQSKPKPIENAREVIERFGGIRPMAKKIDVAVTTVQGWKKRDVIPATRRSAILEAAAEHNVDLTDMISDAPANISVQSEGVANQNDKGEPKEASSSSPATSVPVSGSAPSAKEDAKSIAEEVRSEVADELAAHNLEEKLAEVEKKVVTTNTWITIALILLVLAAAAALLWPKQQTGENYDRLSALEERTQEIEGEVADVKEQQSFFGTMIPVNLDEQLASLKDQAGQVKEQAGQALVKAQEVSDDVLSKDAGTLQERAQKLEGHLQEMTGSPVLAGLLEKIDTMSVDPQGESQLDKTVSELDTIVSGLSGQLGADGLFASTLDAARQSNEALSQTFEGVPTTDLKAAAMLLTMTQFRSTLNRDSAAFDEDLNVLISLVGEDNTELRGALQRLAPHAEDGVLTPAGLSNEFKTMAGDAVVASLKGEDVSVGEKAKARLNELFVVEKDGEMISGTDTQSKLAQADQQLDNGDIEAAIATVESLDAPAQLEMAEWLNKAEVTLMAQKLKSLLTNNINLNAYGQAGALAGSAEGLADTVQDAMQGGSSRLIQNEETGINILQRNTLPGGTKSSGSIHN